MATKRKPRLAVWKFASCDGCQLSLLDCEQELLAVTGQVEIAYFLEASRSVLEGPYDVSLVEGSITTPGDAERIREIREASKFLVAIGACATAGGIQALRNFADVKEFAAAVYARPESHRHAETLLAHRRARLRRLRAARLSDQQVPAAGSDRRASAPGASPTSRHTASAWSASCAGRRA